MFNKNDEQDVFVAGFKRGYSHGRAAKVEDSDIETVAKSDYRTWLGQRNATFGKVVAPGGLNPKEKK